jgi:3-hydroxybutyryl-CoA dehydrogenase
MPILGLVKRMDFTGLDLTQKILSNATYKIPAQQVQSQTVDRLVARGKLGVKTGGGYYEYGGRSTEEIMKERDIKLIKLREFLKELGEL